MSTLTAGFIGLGAQGGPMAMRIALSSIPLGVWARRPAAVQPYVAEGAFAAKEPADLAQCCDVIGLCVFGDSDVREVGERLLPAMAPDSVLLVHSTVHPDTVAALAEEARTAGIGVLDAPVSGGGAAAAEGRLTVMVGGSDEALEKARPVIETYAGLIAHLGPCGAGAKAKLINNAMMAANLATAHEAHGLGAAFGLDRAALTEVIGRSSGASFAHGLYAARGGLGDFGHSVDLLTKDVDLLENLAQGGGGAMTRHARMFFRQVRDAMRG